MRQPLHLVCGPPASGKSTYARVLGARLGAMVVDSDTATERLVRAGLAAMGISPDDRDSAAYKAAFRELVYATLFDLAEANLGHLPVVIAGPFTRECADLGWPARLAERFKTTVTIYFVHAPADVRRARLVTRGEPRDAAKLAAWDAYLATCREDPPRFPHVWVDGARGL